MGINTPFIRAFGHDEKPSALAVLLLQRTKPPQERVARSRKLWVWVCVCDRDRDLNQKSERQCGVKQLASLVTAKDVERQALT